MENSRRSCCSSKLFVISLTLAILNLYFFTRIPISSRNSSRIPSKSSWDSPLRIYIANLPREYNFGLLERYWETQESHNSSQNPREYPTNPLFRQHSAEYWLLQDLLKPRNPHDSHLVTVGDSRDADVVFVPFFAALSAQIQLRGKHKGVFRKKVEENSDFQRQTRVVDMIKASPEWKRSNGVDHVFVLSDPMAMWHVKDEISTAMFLVVDFGGWYIEDAKTKPQLNPLIIQHTHVSPIKDVIIPHTHLLPTLHSSNNHKRNILLYFRGARHRHRNGLVREKLWKVLENQTNVVLEEGVPDEEGIEQATKGMQNSEFCLSPAGDTPSSCRLYDAIASLCIPLVVSDDIQLPFEGLLNYEEFTVFVPVGDAVKPGWLLNKLRSYTDSQKDTMRKNLLKVRRHFEYESSVQDGAVHMIWSKVRQKVPLIRESVARYRRRNSCLTPSSLRCHCVS